MQVAPSNAAGRTEWHLDSRGKSYSHTEWLKFPCNVDREPQLNLVA
ncbi:hypothetical protein ABH999_000695 [Bradyrhizobium yuanmingense]